MEQVPYGLNLKKYPLFINSDLPIVSRGDKYCLVLLFRKQKKYIEKTKQRKRRGGLEVGLGGRGDELPLVQPTVLLFEVVLLMNLEKHSREDKAFSSRAWLHVGQRILSHLGERCAVLGGPTR